MELTFALMIEKRNDSFNFWNSFWFFSEISIFQLEFDFSSLFAFDPTTVMFYSDEESRHFWICCLSFFYAHRHFESSIWEIECYPLISNKFPVFLSLLQSLQLQLYSSPHSWNSNLDFMMQMISSLVCSYGWVAFFL